MPKRLDPFTQREIKRRDDVAYTQLGLLDYGECAHCREWKAERARLEARVAELLAQIETLASRERESVEKLRQAALRGWRRRHFVEQPRLYEQLIGRLEHAKRKGLPHYGIHAAIQELRYAPGTEEAEGAYRIVGEDATIYARMIEELRPDLAHLLGNKTSTKFDGYRPWAEPWTEVDEAHYQGRKALA